MAEKDIMERHLASYNDVFADIVNGCLFILGGGQAFRAVQPDELQDSQARTLYTPANGGIHEQERDVVKLWKRSNTILCLMGLENQTDVDPDMALRVFSYEGGDYRWQLSQKRQNLYPVLTFVLYFGTERRWPEQRSLLDRLEFDGALRPFLNNCHLNVLEVAFLTEQEASVFKSDFRIIVDFLRQLRLNRDFVPSDQQLVHIRAVLQLLSVLGGDKRFESLPQIKRGEIMTVRNVFEEIRQQGIQIGEARGETRGREEGFLNALFSLVGDGLLPLGTAAAKANMSEEEFRARMLAQEKSKDS